jgi:hypothetical protein
MSHARKLFAPDCIYGFSLDDRESTYYENRSIAVPPATEPHTKSSSVAFKDCRLCGQPTMPRWDICQACFDGMRERAERQEEIVKYG